MAAARDPLRRGGVINMACAAGKTVMALYIACALDRRALVVVHKEFLLEQWLERIAQFVPAASVGRVQGAVEGRDVVLRDVVLCMLQTLSGRAFAAGAFDGFGTVVVDECHHASAEVFSRGLHKVNFRYALGLSATVRLNSRQRAGEGLYGAHVRGHVLLLGYLHALVEVLLVVQILAAVLVGVDAHAVVGVAHEAALHALGQHVFVAGLGKARRPPERLHHAVVVGVAGVAARAAGLLLVLADLPDAEAYGRPDRRENEDPEDCQKHVLSHVVF